MRDKSTAPVRRSETLPFSGRSDPFWAFRQEMDRVFDNFFAPAQAGRGFVFAFTPALDVTENDKEICVRAELPGVDEKDVEIHLDGDILSIRGEKHDERSEESDQRRVVERSYGSFERSIRLPFEPNDNEVRADFKNGVLTVTAKKPAQAVNPAKRIPIGNG
ncbi:MAG: Hsp20/alpha crystallin family protein [Hyphomonadaceae bacterium]|nr:Hsp20/alpha crystallin family protein [Hyphomonadaceae bacterium]